MTPAVSFREVAYDVEGRRILENFSLDVAPGETLVLLGRSGSGKTTALKLANGLLLPSAGEVRVQDQSTTQWDLIALRRRIGYVIQEVGLLPHFTVARNVALVTELQGQPISPARVAELLEQVGLPADVASRSPRQLSGGQRQRVGVARALAANPFLLLFDEPFGALDPITRTGMQHLFLDLRQRLNVPSLFVTHDLAEAMRVGSRIALLDAGRLAVLASPEEFRRSEHPTARAFLETLTA